MMNNNNNNKNNNNNNKNNNNNNKNYKYYINTLISTLIKICFGLMIDGNSDCEVCSANIILKIIENAESSYIVGNLNLICENILE
jgi:hypothetical protein